MNPVTIPADFPDCAWELVLLAAVGLCLDGSVGSAWLAGEMESPDCPERKNQ